ncbi:MAG: N-acetylmuramoyl-L-alanine amidase [Methylacidiphilales bacterium]|nr:N-acetylmuramoyl-L-alanine amidase [Candidatus Methylacidiphilales bacterium]
MVRINSLAMWVLLWILSWCFLPVHANTLSYVLQRAEDNQHATIQFYLSANQSVKAYELQAPRRLLISFEQTQTDISALLAQLSRLKNDFVSEITVEQKNSTLFATFIYATKNISIQQELKTNNVVIRFIKDLSTTPTTPISASAAPSPAITQPTTSLVPKKSITGNAQRLVIVIDPGHGGKDPGALGKKVYEKQINLRAALMLKEKLEKIPSVVVKLTRDKDVFVELQDRVEFAQKYRAGLFISLHSDSAHNTKANGASVFALSIIAASSKSKRLLDRPGDAVLGYGKIELRSIPKDLAKTLLDLSQKSLIHSTALGAMLLPEISKVSAIHNHQVQQAAFQVLKSFDFPSLLIEMGFLSNRKDEQNLLNSTWLDTLTNAIAKGIKKFLTTNVNFIQLYGNE